MSSVAGLCFGCAVDNAESVGVGSYRNGLRRAEFRNGDACALHGVVCEKFVASIHLERTVVNDNEFFELDLVVEVE